ncbi:MAG TPA: ATP-binding protein [bacterium]|nr:ATP-binding protein [bacterium]HOX86909.1 ATP-binding protein [bacterium]HPG46240.1 ATP-binding protein [bacterium]HPM98566.1 ATP-binding protein [bacterium]
MKNFLKKLQTNREEWIELAWQDWLASPMPSLWTSAQQKKLLQGLAFHLLQDLKQPESISNGSLVRFCRQNIQRRADGKPELGMQVNLLTRLRVQINHFAKENGESNSDLWFALQDVFDFAMIAISETWGAVLSSERQRDREIIEQLKQVKNDLQQQVNVHYQMIRESPVATMNCDAELLITKWNPMATRMTGYQPGEMLRQSVLKLFAAKSRDLFMQKIHARNERISRLHLNIIKKSGETALALVSVSRIKYPYDDHLFYVISLQDLSVHEQLTSKSKKIDQLMTLSRITSSMMHDIRNPVNTIGLYFDLLADKWAAEGNGEQQKGNLELLEKIQSQISRLSENLNHYLTYQHIPELHVSAVDLDSQLRSLAEETNFEASLKKIKVSYSSQKPAWILADWPQLKRAFLNILQNSIQAIGQDGKIDIDLRQANERAIVRIRDDGPGIPVQILRNIYEPFLTTKESGEGLGLFITRELVRASRGRIRCWSGQGRGTLFTLSFPTIDQGGEAE